MATPMPSRYPDWFMWIVAPPNAAQYEATAARVVHKHATPAVPTRRLQTRLNVPTKPQPEDSPQSMYRNLSTVIDKTIPEDTVIEMPPCTTKEPKITSLTVNTAATPTNSSLAAAMTPSSISRRLNLHRQVSQIIVTQEQQDALDKALIVKFMRRLFAELLGTMILVWMIAAAGIEFNLTNSAASRGSAGLNQTGAGFASGVTLTFLIFSFGAVSGAHFNPCITWAFVLRGLFPKRWLPFYWVAQFSGAILAGGFVRAFYYEAAQFGTPAVAAQYSLATGFAYETLMTFIFVVVVLSLATMGGDVGPQAALADGFTLAIIHMLGISYTSVGCNPARSLGPAIVNGPLNESWVYVAGPMLGATISVFATWILKGSLNPADFDAAAGTGSHGQVEIELGEEETIVVKAE